ncbi:MAG: hypothetical protein PHQ35_05900 [Phycisphaerae bacterium]|nr:hypothetical protein [Phycisphaerae bacterium]MDD5381288.1 hypothetical protein [Phycisphaerae bacterium]
MFDVFEHPWGLIIIAAVASLILLILRSVAPGKYHWWLWLLPALLVVAAFGLDFLVETDLEKINAVIDKGVQAVEDEDPATIETIIADDYADSIHRSKSVLMEYCREMLSEPLIEKNIKRPVSMDIQPPKATTIFTVRILFDKRSFIYQGFKQQMLVEVQANLEKQSNGGWLISRVELLKIDFQPAKWQSIKQANW